MPLKVIDRAIEQSEGPELFAKTSGFIRKYFKDNAVKETIVQHQREQARRLEEKRQEVLRQLEK